MTLFFIEGQGRILCEYNDWARIIFDSLVFAAVMKIFIVRKKVVDFRKVPTPLIVIIALHFLWFLVEFTNLYSLSAFSVLASSKVYIYPLLFFFGLTQIDMDVFSADFQKSLNLIMLIILLELILAIYQFNLKESFVLQISAYYTMPLKHNVFIGKMYRPFGTTHLPGVVAIYTYLTIGFLFLKNESKKLFTLRAIFIVASSYVFILCQVRSAFVKYLMIIVIIHLGEIIYYRFRPKELIGLILIPIMLFYGSQYVFGTNDSTGDDSLDHARDRMLSLNEVDKIKGSRLNSKDFAEMAVAKLMAYPFGFGPGIAGPAGSLVINQLPGNHFLRDDMLWSGDSLPIALIIDFGFGAIFYLLMLVYIPFYFLRFIIILYRKKLYTPYKILLVCFATSAVIIFGNWGAVGLTYNPESFVFWFFNALGFATIAKFKNDQLLVVDEVNVLPFSKPL